MATMAAYALAWGMVPMVFGGFASAEDLGRTQQILTDVRRGQLEADIFQSHLKACEAQGAHNYDAAVLWQQRVQQELPTYRELNNGRPYQLQDCPKG